jgi:hypothetical protein
VVSGPWEGQVEGAGATDRTGVGCGWTREEGGWVRSEMDGWWEGRAKGGRRAIGRR